MPRKAAELQTLALLANGFSGVSGCEPGLKILHAEVVKREGQLSAAQGCRVQHQALLANGFSGVSGCEPGLKILHAEVVKREAQLSTTQGCPGAASGPAGQWVQRGQRLRAGAENPSRRGRQTRGAAGCRARLSGCKHLALLVNGFRGVSGCEPGLKILHAEVVKREAQLSAAQGCRCTNIWRCLPTGSAGSAAASRG